MSQHNSLQSLPPEILIEIIFWDVRRRAEEAAVDVDPRVIDRWLTRLHYARVYELSSVCSSWKALIDATPRLWTRISSSLHPRMNELLLRKSGSASLKVTYEFKGSEAVWLRKQLEPHFGRVEKFLVDVSQRWGMPAQLLPDLTEIKLEALEIIELPHWFPHYGDSEKPAPTVFRPLLPRLRRLLHKGAPITLNWAAISTLTHLNIQRCNTQMFDHDDWALFVLRNNPGLVSVNLSLLRLLRLVPTSSPTPLHLVHLKSLSLISNNATITRRILSALVSPACVHAHVDFRDRYERDVDVDYPLNWSEDRERLALSVILQHGSEIEVEFSVQDFPVLKVILDDHMAFFAECLRAEQLRPALLWLSRVCKTHSGSVIRVSMCLGDYSGESVFVCWNELADVPSVTTLELISPSSEAVAAFLLRDPPVLPSLKVLRLYNIRCASDFMIPIIQYRSANATLARLRELSIRSKTIDREPPEQLKELLGDTKLVWETEY